MTHPPGAKRLLTLEPQLVRCRLTGRVAALEGPPSQI